MLLKFFTKLIYFFIVFLIPDLIFAQLNSNKCIWQDNVLKSNKSSNNNYKICFISNNVKNKEPDCLFECFNSSDNIPPYYKIHRSIIPNPKTVARWTKRYNLLNERVNGKNYDLVFIGDSITQAWEKEGHHIWEQYYEKRNALNLGLNSDRTDNVLWRILHGNIKEISPKMLVLLIGTNNTDRNGTSSQEIAEGVITLVKNFRIKMTKTKILILGIFPRADISSNIREKVVKANEIISKMADNKMIYYQDIGDIFLNSKGTVSREIMPDGIHLNEKGYKIFADSIEENVSKLLEEQKIP